MGFKAGYRGFLDFAATVGLAPGGQSIGQLAELGHEYGKMKVSREWRRRSASCGPKKIAQRCHPNAERIDHWSSWAGKFAIVYEGNLIRLIRLVDLDERSPAPAGSPPS
jgi:hypothetical protein